jgi:hypothetical protein
MRKPLFALTAAALLAALLIPAANAGVAGSGEVTIVHAATFDAGTDFPVTVCVDGEVLIEEFNTTDIEGPLTLPAATYNVQIFAPNQTDCVGDPALAADITVADGDDVTVMAYWGPEGPAVTVLENDTSCVEAGQGRVTARHAAGAGPVDVTVGGAAVLSGLAPGGQASLDVPAGAYPGVEVVLAGTTDVVLDLGTVTAVENVNLVAYVYGGADGDVGVFTDEIPLETCPEPITPTTAAPPAQVATPRITG